MTLRLWTIQAREAWERAHDGPFLRRAPAADRGAGIDPAHRAAYQWMREQMQRRLGPPCSTDSWPIWSWAHYGDGRARPDLRAAGHLPPGCPGVRIAFEIDSDRALLSDFDRWHCVLNRDYLARDEADRARFDARARSIGADSWDLLSSPLRDEVIASWQRIFEVQASPSRPTQATLWHVPLRCVVDVACFVAR